VITTQKNAGKGIEEKKDFSSPLICIIARVLNTNPNIDIPQQSQTGKGIDFKISLIGCIDNSPDFRAGLQTLFHQR